MPGILTTPYDVVGRLVVAAEQIKFEGLRADEILDLPVALVRRGFEIRELEGVSEVYHQISSIERS